MKQVLLACALGIAGMCTSTQALAWGERGHAVIARAAIDALPDDGPTFLKRHADYIAASASTPDSWRQDSEPFLKIEEDPNHGWFREQFAFMTQPPRSRYAFVLELDKERQRIAQSDPERARLMNVRWTGTLPYAAMEGYGRLVANMRQIRLAQAQGKDTAALEQTCGFYAAWFSHYIADGAQPMHDTLHHDGWQGPNPRGYTRDPRVHGRMEGTFVEKIGLTPADLASRIPATPQHQQGDVFDTVLAFLDRGNARVERMYQLDQVHAFDEPGNRQAREMVYLTTGEGSALLRDLVYRAWRESALPIAERSGPAASDPTHTGYDAGTGSAPAARSPSLPGQVPGS